jgi:hypothetical protein
MRRVWAAVWGVALSAALAASCDDDERLPGPKGGSGNAGPTGGVGAAGGGTTGTGGGGPANLCECVAAYGSGLVACADCFNEATALGGACEEPAAACGSGCTAISACLADCATDTECQKACIFPGDGGPEHEQYREVLACVCASCGSTCAHTMPLECPAWGGAGGSGGAGGTGGAGGAGGG